MQLQTDSDIYYKVRLHVKWHKSCSTSLSGQDTQACFSNCYHKRLQFNELLLSIITRAKLFLIVKKEKKMCGSV